MSDPDTSGSLLGGVAFGLLVGFILAWLTTETLRDHVDFWRFAYCMEASNKPDFCNEAMK